MSHKYKEDRYVVLKNVVWAFIMKAYVNDPAPKFIPVGMEIEHDVQGRFSTMVVRTQALGKSFGHASYDQKVNHYFDVNIYQRNGWMTITRSKRGPNGHFFTEYYSTKWEEDLLAFVKQKNDEIDPPLPTQSVSKQKSPVIGAFPFCTNRYKMSEVELGCHVR